MTELDTEEDARARDIYAATPALCLVRKSMLSALFSHGTNLIQHEASVHDYHPPWR